MVKKRFKRIVILITIGIVLSFIILELGLYIEGILFSYSKEKINDLVIQKKDSYNILCLGDSTTAIGGKNSWPFQLNELLNAKYSNKNFSVVNKGVVLADSTKALSYLEKNLDEYSPKIVIIMIGINDAKREREAKKNINKISSFLNNIKTIRLVKLLAPLIFNKKKIYISTEEMYKSEETKQNFNKIKEIIDKKGIKLIMMQYPLRESNELEKVFKSKDGIIFVDNKKIFEAAIEKHYYEEYFVDRFGGDFGHCTKKGNKLIAENILNYIMNSVS